MYPGAFRIRTAALVAIVSLFAGCRSGHDELLRLAPGLDPEIAAHLVDDDPQDFQRFARDTGRAALGRAQGLLRTAPPTASLEEFVRVESVLEPYVVRLVDALSTDPRMPADRLSYEAYRRRSPEQRLAAVELLKDIAAAHAATSVPIEARAAKVRQLIERSKPFSDVIDAGDLYAIYASFMPQLGRREEIPHWLQLGLEAALAFHDHAMACQILGTLGVHYANTGDSEAMRRAWDSALVYARQIDSWQEARILTFYGAYYRSRGQLAITRDLLLEAQDRCRQIGATEIELRFVLDALQFFADLDCWEVVGRGLRRAEMAYAEGRRQLAPEDDELEHTRLQVLRARHAATIGRCTEARDLALIAADQVDRWSLGPSRSALIRLNAARALAQCGDTVEARRLLQHGLEQCTSAPVPELADDYAVELAQVDLALGELEEAEALLGRFPPDEGSRLAVRHGILMLRLAMLRGDRTLAFRRLQEGLLRLVALETSTGRSPEGYIALAANDELRRLGHDLLARSPEAGYAFELWWRTPPARHPQMATAPVSEAVFVAGLIAEARHAVAMLAARDAIHCVYDVRDDGVIRFTASGTGITEERVGTAAEALRARVQRVCSALSQPAPGPGPVDPARAEDFRRLASELLPASVRRSPPHLLFLVTANDCLSRLPFETLDIGTTDYVPLGASTDVASIRYWNAADAPPADSAVVVSNPVYSTSLRRRYSILNESLPASSVEAADVRNLLPRTSSLTGSAATKRNLLERWRRARLLYFAGHVVQDPELPYVMFVPMSEAPEGYDDASYLEVADVRSTDLSRCRLVVLSGCESGVPYLSGRAAAPSLADVFVDAGAGAVVSTSWAVRDEPAARVMREFIRYYAAGETDPIGALCRARRAVQAEMPDPHFWAAYSVTVGRLERTEAGPVARATRGDP